MSFLSTSAAQAQAASSNSAHPDISAQPNQAAPAYFTITPNGTSGTSGNYSILVGQQCHPIIKLPPYIYGTTITYQWTVSGTTFQSWSVVSDPNNQSHTTEADGSGDLTLASPSWYWNDVGPQPTSETISCMVTATSPAGQTQPYGNGSGTVSVSVQVPTLQAYGIGGYMQVNKAKPDDTAHNNLWAGPTAYEKSPGKFPGGMNWEATLNTPTSPAFGTGSLEMVQLVTPNNSYTTVANPTVTVSDPENNNSNSLDGTYPYGVVSPEQPGDNLTYNDDDAPGLQLDGSNVLDTANKGGSYTDYMMYMPPVAANSASTWVLLATFSWSASGSATIPGNNSWSSYTSTSVAGASDGAGAVTPPGSNPPQNSLPTLVHSH